MKFLKTDFYGDTNIGIYGFATDKYVLLGIGPKNKEQLEKILKAKIHVISIASSQLIGLFCSGNKNGIIITKLVEKNEIQKLKEILDINIEIIETEHTAQGNLILCNDNGCLISPLIEKYQEKIEKCLNVPVKVGKIGEFDIVGSVAIANNKGCLVCNDITDEQVKTIEDLLKVKVDVGSINGKPFIKSGIINNSNGTLISKDVTGPELQRIMEVFK
ncbi:MAG: translation initiation factor IF-6 [Candidatus Aenigmarchaeota archaeon]|nr:translation initiation factor IF-6 [Candidatus Aenigmarchaeota archaeon]